MLATNFKYASHIIEFIVTNNPYKIGGKDCPQRITKLNIYTIKISANGLVITQGNQLQKHHQTTATAGHKNLMVFAFVT